MPGLQTIFRDATRSVAAALSPALFPVWNLWNRLTARGEKALVLIGTKYGRDLVRRLREAGHYVVILDRQPQALNWRLANEAQFLDTFDLANTARIVELARRLGVKAVLAQSDDRLIPQVAAVNNALGTVNYSGSAVRCSLSKAEMHAALERAGVPTVPNAVVTDERDLQRHGVPYPVIAKADVGQGAHGYRICGDLEELRLGFNAVRKAFPDTAVLIEHYLTGRQFDIEGIVHRGEVRPYIVTEEDFFRHAPDLMRCWYLFNPNPGPETAAELDRIVRDALAACDFRCGAFHVEVRLDAEGRAYAIDLSNRMGADFPPSVRTTTGRDMIHDYCLSMTGNDVPPPPPAMPVLELRYYAHAFEPGRRRAAEVARRHATFLREDGSPDGSITMFVFMSDSEQELRSLIGTLDEILGND